MISSQEEFDIWKEGQGWSIKDSDDKLWACWQAARTPSLNTYKNEIWQLSKYTGALLEQYTNGMRQVAPQALVLAADDLTKAYNGNPSIGELRALLTRFNEALFSASSEAKNDTPPR